MATKPRYPFVRPLSVGVENGTDVQGIKRALSRTGYLKWGKFDNIYSKRMQAAVKRFQQAHGLKIDGKYGKRTHTKLVAAKPKGDHPGEHAFDDYAGELLWAEHERRQVDPALRKAQQLLTVCKKFRGPYVYGGGHGQSLDSITYTQGLDCSSSTSKALYDVDLFPSSYAIVSSSFESYGSPGHGRYVTIQANWEHVWVQFTLPNGWYRFDTSPHGCGPRGPRVRTCRRFDSTFRHRHPPRL
jgi:peptidoglycan hydrolase-like protein with peptidoglycan-binding domain